MTRIIFKSLLQSFCIAIGILGGVMLTIETTNKLATVIVGTAMLMLFPFLAMLIGNIDVTEDKDE